MYIILPSFTKLFLYSKLIKIEITNEKKQLKMIIILLEYIGMKLNINKDNSNKLEDTYVER